MKLEKLAQKLANEANTHSDKLNLVWDRVQAQVQATPEFENLYVAAVNKAQRPFAPATTIVYRGGRTKTWFVVGLVAGVTLASLRPPTKIVQETWNEIQKLAKEQTAQKTANPEA